MDNSKINSLSSKIQLLSYSEVEFPQKLKQHLVFKSDQVSNPFKFISGLLSKGVLCDGSNDLEANFGLKEMMVRLAMMIACAKGADGIGGLMEALEESGNSQLVSDFRAWVKESYGVESEFDFGEPKQENAAVLTPKPEALAKQMTNGNEMGSDGTKFIDKIMSRVEHGFMEQLQGHLVSKASEIANVPEFYSSLAHQKVLDETDIQMATGPQVQDEQQVEKVIKAVCSKRAIGSLVVALQISNNEGILVETNDWLETLPGIQKNYPISVKSLAKERKRNAAGLFAATETGLIFLDLQTLEATTLTSETAYAVAVNHKLKKVYWTQGVCSSSIMRSNFDGSNKEMIIPQADDYIFMLAIEETSGKLYFALYDSHEIRVCNALGHNCAVVISNPYFVNYSRSIALDSVKGFMYWGNRGSNPQSLIRANLDGSSPTKISTGFKDLIGLTLDQPSNDVLYWADLGDHTIGAIDVSGVNKRTLVKLEGNPGPFGIQVDAHKIYVGDWFENNIKSVDKDSGAKLTTIFNSTGIVYHLAYCNTPVSQY